MGQIVPAEVIAYQPELSRSAGPVFCTAIYSALEQCVPPCFLSIHAR